jgi:DNA-binding SARP family transcriptional activator
MATDDVHTEELAGAVRLQLLEGFRLTVDGSVVDTLASAQRLLAFLALRGPVVRAVAAGTLWGDFPERHALGSLRTTMWRVNRTVTGMVAARRSQVALASFVRVDVAELADSAADVFGGTDAVTGPRQAELRHGELLPGWYEDWVIFERERLRHLRLHVLEAVAAKLAAQGQFAAALEAAFEAVRCEPLRESAHRAVIVVHLAEHNLVEARREYDRFRDLLMDQVGVEPSESLTALVRCGAGAGASSSA